jgi:broad specificity phosphatase PhoE
MGRAGGRVALPALKLVQPFRYSSTTTTTTARSQPGQGPIQLLLQGPKFLSSSSSTTRRMSAGSPSLDNDNTTKNQNDTTLRRNVLQIYPLECYEELLEEQQQQPQQSTSSSSSSNSNSMIESIHRIHIVRHAEGYHNVEKDYKNKKNRDARLTPKGMDQCAALARYVRYNYNQLFYQSPPDTKGSSGGPSSSTRNKNKNTNILVVTSTMTRCIQTALHAFPDLAATSAAATSFTSGVVPFVAHEGIRETVNYDCDARRSLSTLVKEFPRIDFETAVGFPMALSFSSSCAAATTTTAATAADAKDDKEAEEDDTDDPIWNAYRERFGMDYDGPCESAELHVVARRGYHFFQWLVQHYNNNNNGTTTAATTITSTKRITDVILCTHSAFLRCILSWNQVGGVPQQMAQTMDNRTDNQKDIDSFKLFEYCPTTTTTTRTTTTTSNSFSTSSDQSTADRGEEAGSGLGFVSDFEASMRKDYENCELRSFCLVQRRRGG